MFRGTPTALANGLKTRDFTIKAGKTGHSVIVVQLTDLHIGICNEKDLGNKTLAQTYAVRGWSKRPAVIQNALRGLAYADSVKADQIMITGDALDYLSQGGLDWLKTNVWNRYPNGKALISTGNHEFVQKMQGTVEEQDESVRQKLLDQWGNEIYYESRVLRNKVMVIQMDNGTGSFRNEQVSLLRADLALAREKGYTVLLFFHEPISTGNPKDRDVNASYVGEGAGTSFNFYTGSTVANPFTDPDSTNGAIYRMIVNSADVVGGVFCGHLHADYYTEIQAKTPDGQAKVIPQYDLTGTPYDKGHALKITVQ